MPGNVSDFRIVIFADIFMLPKHNPVSTKILEMAGVDKIASLLIRAKGFEKKGFPRQHIIRRCEVILQARRAVIPRIDRNGGVRTSLIVKRFFVDENESDIRPGK